MLDKLIATYLKKFGLDKYVTGVTLHPVNSTYCLSVGNKTKTLTVGFEITPEYKDEVEFVLGLLGK